jgi:hypothetical protein
MKDSDKLFQVALGIIFTGKNFQQGNCTLQRIARIDGEECWSSARVRIPPELYSAFGSRSRSFPVIGNRSDRWPQTKVIDAVITAALACVAREREEECEAIPCT